MIRRAAINAVERSGQPVRIVGGKTVENLRHIPIHQPLPKSADAPVASFASAAGSLFELLP